MTTGDADLPDFAAQYAGRDLSRRRAPLVRPGGEGGRCWRLPAPRERPPIRLPIGDPLGDPLRYPLSRQVHRGRTSHVTPITGASAGHPDSLGPKRVYTSARQSARVPDDAPATRRPRLTCLAIIRLNNAHPV